MNLFHYAGCSTCRKARAWLTAEGHATNLVDLVEAPPSAATLKDLHKRSGLPLQKFFNTSGQSYRDGGFSSRIGTMTDAEKFAALAADGKLIKRPILDTGDAVLVGFSEATWRQAVAKP